MAEFLSIDDNVLALLPEDATERKLFEHENRDQSSYRRDLWRILDSPMCRALGDKTQVLHFPILQDKNVGLLCRNRLVHTIDVKERGIRLGKELGLNCDLIESIAMAHDLGHPPFGHTGERALNKIMERFGSFFNHNNQSLRVVELLIGWKINQPGLNLTRATLDGLRTRCWNGLDKISLEAQIVELCDSVAYSLHDLDDFLYYAAIEPHDIDVPIVQDALKRAFSECKGKIPFKGTLLPSLKTAIFREIRHSLYKNSKEKIGIYKDYLKKGYILYNPKSDKLVDLEPEVKERLLQLKNFLFENFYRESEVIKKDAENQQIIFDLFDKLMLNLELRDLQPIELFVDENDPSHVVITDYIASLTDTHAVALWE